MSERYWLTIATSASGEAHARERARVAASQVDGQVVDVQPEPPQGSTIVGDMHEDELADEAAPRGAAPGGFGSTPSPNS